jgi:GNAT superfamily N-acetyltransferase
LKWTLRHSLRPGDIGYLTYLHGIVYAREYGYDTTFEAYVAGGLAEFAESFDPKKDRIWLVETKKHRIVGSIAIVGRSRWRAQLRWFFVHPDHRGHGIGRTLLKEALQFCKWKYRGVFLWTTSELDAARHLYQGIGFKKNHEKEHQLWGKPILEERYHKQI